MTEENSKKWNCWTITLTVVTCVIWTVWLVARLTVGGLCASPPLADNFTKEAYLGRWHQQFVAKGRFEWAECVTATYAAIDETDI